MIRLTDIERALQLADVPTLPAPPTLRERAAVSLVLAGPSEALSLCFILRAERPGDRWSGQMALPGGRAEPFDASPRHTAMRETQEEVGLKLSDSALLGQLPELPIMRRGAATDGVLSPFAFYLGDEPAPLQGNGDEVAAAWWIALEHLWNPGHLTTVDYEHEGAALQFPGIRFADQVIWGLTLRVLTQFAELVGRPLPGGQS